MITIKEIAEKLGMSTTTVSNVIHGKAGEVSEETRIKVEEFLKEVDYVPNINARNEALSQLADNKTIFYMDMNEAVDDENGNLLPELTFDDIHLKASSYERWYEFLLNHGIVKE